MNSDLSDALEEETPQEIVQPEDVQSLYSENSFGPVAARIVIEVVQSAVGVLKTAIVYPCSKARILGTRQSNFSL